MSEEATKPKMPKNTAPAGAPTTVNFTFDDMKNFMHGEFRTAINEDIDRGNKKLSERIDSTQAELRSHKVQVEKEMQQMRKELDDRKAVPIGSAMAALPLPQLGNYAAMASKTRAPSARSQDDHDKRQFLRSRRSSRFFPVSGVTDEELRQSLEEFFLERLRIPAEDLRLTDVEHVRRVRMRRGKESLAEVTVLFCDIETRDRVTSYARNLGSYVDGQGKPTAGIRFEIPDHLSGIHRTLLQYGHALWTKYGRDSDFKRNVRFDDVEMTFCLNVKLPKKKEWKTVTYKRALLDRRVSATTAEEDQDDALSTTGIPVVEEDSAQGVNTAGGTVTVTSWRAPTGM